MLFKFIKTKFSCICDYFIISNYQEQKPFQTLIFKVMISPVFYACLDD